MANVSLLTALASSLLMPEDKSQVHLIGQEIFISSASCIYSSGMKINNKIVSALNVLKILHALSPEIRDPDAKLLDFLKDFVRSCSPSHHHFRDGHLSK